MDKRSQIQKEAVDKWVESGLVGTCELPTGLGKTFVALKALETFPENDGKVHLFLAEVKAREIDLEQQILKYNEIFNTDIRKKYQLKFACYQAAYRWKNKSFGLVIADEIHDSISPAYLKFYKNNSYDGLIGLSATVNSNQKYKIDNVEYSKRELLNNISPVCYTYSLSKSIKESVSRKLDIYVISHKLEDVKRTIKAGSKNKPFFQTERKAYDYWENRFKQTLFYEGSDKDLKIKIIFAKLNKILYNLPSKEIAVKKLLSKLKGKTILFGNSIDQLSRISPYTISSKNTDDKNSKILNDFDKGDINHIASFKMLKQGANLKGLDNCIQESFYSVDKDFIQRVGRLRKQGDKTGSVFIFVSKNTREEKWLVKMLSDHTSDLNVYNCRDVEHAVLLYRNNYFKNN